MLQKEQTLCRPSEYFIQSRHTQSWPRMVMVQMKNTQSWLRMVMVQTKNNQSWPRLVMLLKKNTHFWPRLVMHTSDSVLVFLRYGVMRLAFIYAQRIDWLLDRIKVHYDEDSGCFREFFPILTPIFAKKGEHKGEHKQKILRRTDST